MRCFRILTLLWYFTGCGKNWYLLGDTCYLFNTSGATWAGARKRCKDMGADLLTIKTRDVQSFVTGKIIHKILIKMNETGCVDSCATVCFKPLFYR